PSSGRYEAGMEYRRSGRSGILLSELSLGFWHNFGETAPLERSKEIMRFAFDHGITSYDLANNYGPGYGTAEETFGYVYDKSFRPYRDEMFIASKAGYDMWPGPYGNWGSRKYLMASIDQSLKRTHLDYFDVFYSHRYDPETPLEETLQALVDIVKMGKSLYIGISRWPVDATKFAFDYLRQRDTPCLIFQDRLNLIDRRVESDGTLDNVRENGCGFIGFTPLAQGILTNRYLNGIPADSRAMQQRFLKTSQISDDLVANVRALNDIAENRGQTLAQMALSWVLSHSGVTSVIVGCSSVSQLADSLQAVKSKEFTAEDLDMIETIASKIKI
ncbi:MAG: aldo/keto reductase, partial [Muribaculaceae bacterium]|nr:aldo/keto reductase [Muribaculaceae bacterium]